MALLILKDGFLTQIMLVLFHSLGKYFLIRTSAEQLIPEKLIQKLLSKSGTTFTIYLVENRLTNMYKLEVISRWNNVKAALKQRYMLTDEDLLWNQGRENELLVRLQKKLGKSKADVMRMIGEVC